MSPEQKAMALELRGKYPRHKIAEMVGCSLANLGRFARDEGKSFLARRYSKKLVAEVIAFYEQHGKKETAQRFPDINVRSIVERYPHVPRQVRWTERQMRQLVRMSGLVPHHDQARYFNRPNANAGSIQSFWMKRLGISDAYVHGMPASRAKFILNKGFQITYVPLMNGSPGRKPLVLWVHMTKHLGEWVPDYMVQAINVMAQFQRWIFNSQKPERSIQYMLKTKVSA